MRIRRPHYLLALALLVALGVVLSFGVHGRFRSSVVVTFLAYTNSPHGDPYALFGITNFDMLSVERLSPSVEIDDDPNPHAPGFDPALPWLPRSPVKPSDSKVIAIRVPPEASSRWRLVVKFERLTVPERLRDYVLSRGRPVPLSIGGLTILGPPYFCSTNSSWMRK